MYLGRTNMTQVVDGLYVKEGEIILRSVAGQEVDMPNLTKLVEIYHDSDDVELKKRIKNILEQPFGKLFIVETMVDMTNETTLNRLASGDISKNMKHVQTYNLILDSHIEKARTLYAQRVEEGTLEGTLEDAFFAPFPYGMIIEESKFPGYENEIYVNEIIGTFPGNIA